MWQRFQQAVGLSPKELTQEISIANPRVQTTTGRTFNPDYLTRIKGLKEYDKVRRDDQVKAALTFKKLAVLKSGWTIDSPEAQGDDWEVAQFVRLQLEQLPGTLNETLRAIMTALDYGFSVSEKIYYPIDSGPYAGKLGLKAIKTRAPHDIGFDIEPGGDILEMGITQNELTMPRAKFVLFTHEGEFGDPFGKPDLEAAYRPWFAKDNAYKWLLMGLERYGVDPIIATYNQAAIGASVQTAFATMLQRLQAATTGLVPRGENDKNITFWQPQQSGPMVEAFTKALDMFNRDIARALLMPGLLGFTADQSQGSLARSETHFEAFVLVIEALRRTIAEDVVQAQIIRQLVDLNYGPQEEYPRFTFLPLTKDMQVDLATTWGNLTQSGVVTFSDADEDHFREMFELPERDAAQARRTPNPVAPEGVRPFKAVEEKKKTSARELSPAERRVDFAALDKSLEASAASWTERLTGDLNTLLGDVESRIEKDFDGTSEAAVTFDLAFGDKLKNALKKFLTDLYRKGRNDLRKELPRKFENELPNVDPEDALAYLEAKALNISGVLEQRLVNDARQAMLTGVSAGESNAQIVERLREVFAPYVGATVAGDVIQPSRLETIVRTNLTDAYNQGRLVQGREAGDLLEAWQYSAIMDDRTTPVCRELDGKVFMADDPNVDTLRPPRHFNCRSLMVPIVIGDEYNESDVITEDQIALAKRESGTGF